MKTFYVGVKGLIVNDGKVLLVRGETTGRDFWDTPGGRMDDDETIVQTLDRELREELPNIQSYEPGELLYAHRIHRDIEGEVSLVLLFYTIKDAVFAGEPQISDEHTHIRWIPLAEAIDVATSSVSEALKRLN